MGGANEQGGSVEGKVCALLSGGGYAEKVAVPAVQVLPIPHGVSLTDAASLAEVACAVWSTVFMMSHLSPGENFPDAGLRNRTIENKSAIMSEVEKIVWPDIGAGKVKPIVYKVLPLSEAAEAHRIMESSTQIGKILLVP